MSNENLIDSGIKLPVHCPECGRECEYIQTGKHGNILTREPESFVAFFGCKPCYIINVVDCEQVWGAFEYAEQGISDERRGVSRNRVDEYFGIQQPDNGWDDEDDDYLDEGEFE